MATITPLGERARGNRWGRTALAYTAGCLAGGWTLGAGAGAAGLLLGAALPERPGTALAAAAAVAVVAGIVELAAWPVPTVRRQVDDAWVGRYRGWVYGTGFGVQLGAGLVTTVTTAAVYAFLAMAALLGTTGRIGWATGAGAVFGLTRALPVLAAGSLNDAARVRRRGATMARVAPAGRLATGASLCVLGAAALVAA